jgi:hypothetical protein
MALERSWENIGWRDDEGGGMKLNINYGFNTFL